MIKSLRLIVTGTVQGVGLGKYIKECAEEIGGIQGIVQRLDDESIEVLVSGESEGVETLIDAIYQGTPKSRVERVEVQVLVVPKDFRRAFRVIAD